MLTWKYTLPAFLVPFVFTLSPEGVGVLLRGPLARRSLVTSLTAAVGVGGARGGSRRVGSRAGVASRASGSARSGGLLLFYAAPWADAVGPRHYCCGAVLALLAGSKTRVQRAREGNAALSHQLRDGPRSQDG